MVRARPVAGREVRSWGHGPLGLGTRLWDKSRRLGPRQGEERGESRGGSEGMIWAVAPSDRTDGPCDHTAALPRDTSLDLADHNLTTSLDMGRLNGWFESHL
ncbi:hypothetical protein F2Q68_00033349 [Brassica cretica]|uniref:Uncharacterized protein n=1 Tax=Brassica cretica TaxID=69181 RepID=A0A8S9H5E0_BRACR|nr:hypothetical protein F2Q68_00033349 [Brassica cretica]